MLAAGTTIGAYRLSHQLGEGGMGAVYLAEHALLGRKAAIKVLLPSLSINQDIVQRFFNEARAITQIADPGIVQVFDFGKHTDGSAYLVMELLEGESLDRRLARVGRLSIGDTLRLMRQICASLRAAHAKGIIHRDLKPDNIYVVGDPAVTGCERTKILDFGIAKLSSDEPGKLATRTGQVIGTPMFMSPEQCRSSRDIDQRSDIYSIGCVMMMMLTGRPPFDGDSSGELIAAHLRETPPLASSRLPGIPEVIDYVLLRCLAKPVAERFQNIAQLDDALAAAEHQSLRLAGAAGMQVHISGPSSSMRTTLSNASGQRQLAASRRRGRLGVLAVAVIVIASVAFMTTRSREADPMEVPQTAPVMAPQADPALVPRTAPVAAPSVPVVPVDAGLAPVVLVTSDVPTFPDAAIANTAAADAAVSIAAPPIPRARVQRPAALPRQEGKEHVDSSGSNMARPIDRGD
jgi:hypothetical protein